MTHHDVNINNHECLHGLCYCLILANMYDHGVDFNKNVFVFGDLAYSLLLAEGKDDQRVRTNKLFENNSIR